MIIFFIYPFNFFKVKPKKKLKHIYNNIIFKQKKKNKNT